jgi:hypothetical protein
MEYFASTFTIMLLRTDREDLLQTEVSLNLPILILHKLCQQRLLVPENKKTIIFLQLLNKLNLFHFQES